MLQLVAGQLGVPQSLAQGLDKTDVLDRCCGSRSERFQDFDLLGRRGTRAIPVCADGTDGSFRADRCYRKRPDEGGGIELMGNAPIR